MKRTLAAIAACFTLAACAHSGGVVRTQLVPVSKPVIQPCASERPKPPASLYDETPDWANLTLVQQIAAAGLWAFEWQSYGEHLNAATGGCP